MCRSQWSLYILLDGTQYFSGGSRSVFAGGWGGGEPDARDPTPPIFGLFFSHFSTIYSHLSDIAGGVTTPLAAPGFLDHCKQAIYIKHNKLGVYKIVGTKDGEGGDKSACHIFTQLF